MRLPVIRAVVALGTLLGASAAWGQCGTTAPGGTLYGNAGTVQGPCQPLTAPVLGRNGSAGGSLTLRGATTGSVQLKVPAAAGTGTNFQFPNTNGTSGFVLQTDGSGNTSWVATTSGGTVTSVGLSLPGIFTVSGSPVTTTGTLTGTLATQGANLVWAGPTTGAASAPTFRSLVGADLPNPSASTLGGIQSTAGVSHQWISSISTLGVPGLSQPAFTDISGSITPAQCPNPSASTIGCVQSLAAVTSKWINTISTSGVPSATQPNFTDIAGNATLAQLPSLSNNTVIGNNSGGTSVPQALSASQVLDMINNVQGDVLYRNASGWVVLAPGTSGQVLTTSGAAANPAWATVTGTGTVTSVATSGGLTGGPITTTGTLSLASIATGNVLAYTGAGSGTPVATTPSAVLDVIGSSTGSLLYRAAGGTGWQALAAGSNGQVLTMGASTPAWGSAGSVSNVTINGDSSMGTFTGTCNISTTGTCTIVGSAKQLPGTTTNDNASAGNLAEYFSTGTGTNNASATVTITIASPAVVTWTGHGFTVGAATTAVKFTNSGGSLPTGITAGTTYYAKAIDANTFNIATSADNALAGTFVNTSGSQSGTQTADIRVTMATSTPQNLAAFQLGVGDWQVSGQVLQAAIDNSTTVSYVAGNLATTSATADKTWGRRLSIEYSAGTQVIGNAEFTVFNVGPARFSLSGTTTIYVVGQSAFGTSGMVGSGWVSARRAR